MDIKLNSITRQMSTLHTAHFAKSEEKNDKTILQSNSDQVTFSQEGQKAVSNQLENLANKVAEKMSSMTKEDFMEQVKQLENKNQNKLKIDPYKKVDPHGSIARKTYFESYLGQLKDTEDTIKNYYTDAYNEATASEIDSITFISGKYLCTWSDYFDPSMPAKERQWTHHQLWAMLTDSHIALNDPYALSSSGGPKTVEQMDKIAKQAVKEKLEELLKEMK